MVGASTVGAGGSSTTGGATKICSPVGSMPDVGNPEQPAQSAAPRIAAEQSAADKPAIHERCMVLSSARPMLTLSAIKTYHVSALNVVFLAQEMMPRINSPLQSAQPLKRNFREAPASNLRQIKKG